MIFNDTAVQLILMGLFSFLLLASLIGFLIAKFKINGKNQKTIDNLNKRINAWWVMSIIFLIALIVGTTGTLVLFMFISFFALRECITITPTQFSDHQVLFWCFFVFYPFNIY